MKYIILTKGYTAKIDDDDFERLIQYKWYALTGTQIRAVRHYGRKMRYMHHEVLNIDTNTLFNKEVDHVDNDPLNNTKSNLRIVSHFDNMLNTRRHKERKGYCYNKRANLWTVYLDAPYRARQYFGYAKTEEEAKQRALEVRNAYHTNL